MTKSEKILGATHDEILRALAWARDFGKVREIKDQILKKGGRVITVGDIGLNTDDLWEMADGAWLLETWHFANEWGNTPKYAIFPTVEKALDYYQENYKARAEEYGKMSLDEWEKSDGERPDTAPLDEWRDLCECVAFA